MFLIDAEKKQIHCTRGDFGIIEVSSKNEDGTDYEFQKDDVVRFKVFKKKDCGCVEIQKDTIVNETSTLVKVELEKDDTKIGELINKPTDYWYEVELNPDTKPQTIIGYDKQGEKLFTLYPEGADKND